MRKRVQVTEQAVNRHSALVNNIYDSLNCLTNRGGKRVPSVNDGSNDLAEYVCTIRHILDEAIPNVDNSVNDVVPRLREPVNQNRNSGNDRSDSKNPRIGKRSNYCTTDFNNKRDKSSKHTKEKDERRGQLAQ